MKNHTVIAFRFVSTLFFMLVLGVFTYAQEEESGKDLRPVKNLFESIWLIDNQSAYVPIKGTFEFDILHRFGTVENGVEDFFGFYAPSNIRLGFNYVPVEKLMVGFGLTKTNLTWDLNAKYAIINQARAGGSPVAVTYFVNTAIDTRDESNFLNSTDRFSYFHQVMVARKFNDKFSMQVAGSLSHFNSVEAFIDDENQRQTKTENDHIAISASARYKVGPWVNIIANYDQPITQHDVTDPKPNIAFGLELTSSSHQFQIFAGNFYSITPQRNNVYNTNSFGDGNILMGFNITRLWNF